MATTTTNGRKTGDAPIEELPATPIRLKRLRRDAVPVPIVGTTPLIMHNWSQKSREMMLAAQQTKTRTLKSPKDPQADYEAAFYRLEDGRPGMPAVAFKAAITDAARFYDGITMTSLKAAMFVRGEGVDDKGTPLVVIEGEPSMREDTPRNATGVADLRYRPVFLEWSALLVVEFLPTMIDLESVVALVDAAGGNGVGDWRPSSPKSKTGMFGQWRVADEFGGTA